MSNNNNENMPENKTMNRSSFLKTIGALGAVGTIPFLAAACSEKKEKPMVYQGTNKDAIIDNIMTRRAIRKYTDAEVPQEILDTVMRCAIFAPSSFNRQPWEVRVIRNPDLILEIHNRWKKTAPKADAALARDPKGSVTHHAPVLIMIAGDTKNASARNDVGIMLQTILLSAHALGLGTCPIGRLVPPMLLPENQDVIKLLNIPEGFEIMGNIALGYPAESPEAKIRYSDKVKYIR